MTIDGNPEQSKRGAGYPDQTIDLATSKRMLDEKFEAFTFSPGNFGTARTQRKNWELKPAGMGAGCAAAQH